MADFDSTKTYFIKGVSLKRLADIVREKIGKNIPMNLEQMGNYIYNLKTDGFVPPDGILISGDCNNLFGNNYANDMILYNGDRITTANLTDISYLFINCDTLESFPFTLNAVQGLDATGLFKNCKVLQVTADNLAGLQGYIQDMDYGFYNCNGIESIPAITFVSDGNAYDYSHLFNNCTNLKEVGALTNMNAKDVRHIFYNCNNLRHCPEFVNFSTDMMKTENFDNTETGSLFYNCFSLRTIPEEFLEELYCSGTTNKQYGILHNAFVNCWVLDEIKGINPLQIPNFTTSFKDCCRVKDITFATQEDGTPYKVEWAGLTLDLSSEADGETIGHFYTTNYYVGGGSGSGSTRLNKITSFNSGITTDKKVNSAATYEALKDDPDWWTDSAFYSRYNRASAINTINSLPDTIDYINATGRSYNTIKFLTYMGGYTKYDETAKSGGLSKLTAEEIAVATAKGWTVAFTGTTSY